MFLLPMDICFARYPRVNLQLAEKGTGAHSTIKRPRLNYGMHIDLFKAFRFSSFLLRKESFCFLLGKIVITWKRNPNTEGDLSLFP